MTEISQEAVEQADKWRAQAESTEGRNPSDLFVAICWVAAELRATREVDAAAIQAQVLAGAKGALALVPYNAKEDIAQGVNPDVAIEDAINAALATLNPNKGEADGHDFKLAETCPTCGKPVEGEGLRSAVADAVEKLAGPLGRAHVRAEKGSEQEAELAEVVEQIGAIREAVEPGITAAIDALNHAQGADQEGKG